MPSTHIKEKKNKTLKVAIDGWMDGWYIKEIFKQLLKIK